MQTFREKGHDAKSIISSHPDKGWKLNTVKKVCSRVNHIGSAILRKPSRGRPATAFSFYGWILKTWQGKNDCTRRKFNAIWWNIKINLQKLVDTCGYELLTNLQNFMQKDLTKVKIFQKVGGDTFFLKHPVVWHAPKSNINFSLKYWTNELELQEYLSNKSKPNATLFT